MSSAVSRPPAADSAHALAHFESLLEFETDCWDVHHDYWGRPLNYKFLFITATNIIILWASPSSPSKLGEPIMSKFKYNAI